MKRKKRLFPHTKGENSMQGVALRGTDASGIVLGRTISLSTPIVSAQDGPRMTLSNLGGKKAAPFRSGGKRRAKLLAAKTAVKKRDAARFAAASARKTREK